MISARFTGLEAELERMARALDRGAERGMRAASAAVAAEARARHTYQNRSGDLQRATRALGVVGTARAGNLIGGVIADTNYAQYVDEAPGYEFLEPAWVFAEDRASAAMQAALDAAFQGIR